VRRPPHLLAPTVTGLVVPVRIDPLGVTGPTKPQSRGPRWRTTSPGRFVPSAVGDELVEQRIVEASCRAGDRAVVTGWASLRLWGAGYFDGLARDGATRLAVPIATNGERLQHHDGILASRFAVPPDEIVVIQGIRCASVERSLFDEMRRVRFLRAMVVPADMTFAAELTSIARMRRYRADRRWYRDVRTVDQALGLCDENAWSPYEVDYRLVWRCDAGWGHPLCNRQVLDLDGRPVGIPDLIDPVRGVVGEFAGAHHRDKVQHGKDIAREADLRDVGLEYVEAVSADIVDFPRLVRRLHEAERRAKASTLPRRWKLGPPLTPSLDDLLDARDRRAS
jgi:hypothetical protein